MLGAKFFGRRAQRDEDREREAMLASIYTSAIGDLGPADSMPLGLYCVCAITGFVLQQVMLVDRMRQGLPQRAPDIVTATTADGRMYAFGDAVAAALMRNGDEQGIIGWLADQGRLAAQDRDMAAWFGRPAATVGSTDYGRPSPPLDAFRWPAIDDVIANTDAVTAVLKAGGLVPAQYGTMLTNAARVALLRAAADRRIGTLSQLTVLGIEAAICGSHIVRATTTAKAS